MTARQAVPARLTPPRSAYLIRYSQTEAGLQQMPQRHPQVPPRATAQRRAGLRLPLPQKLVKKLAGLGATALQAQATEAKAGRHMLPAAIAVLLLPLKMVLQSIADLILLGA